MAAPQAPQPIGERFVFEVQAASGGMGTVWRGRDQQTGAPVAIKVLHRRGVSDRERFLREGTILAELAHPGIIRYVAHGILADGSPYLVMDWIDGETLDQRLHGDGLSIADSLTIARRVAAALAFAHARGVVHRDIKPSNLIFPDGDLDRTIVLDFGVARATAQPSSLTETGSVIGTPSYMAPEQVRGERDVGPAADVFALGCVLYECLTGRLTFEGMRFLALRAKIILWDPPPADELTPDVPAALTTLIQRMLAKNPTARPRDAGELVALFAALPPLPLASAVGTPIRRSRRRTDAPTDVQRPRSLRTGPPRQISIVVATSPDGVDASVAPTITFDDLGPLRDSLEEAVRPFGAALDVLHDGAMIASLAGALDPREQAHRAAGCARAIRAALPDALIGVATGDATGSAEADLIENAVRALARDAITMVFSGVGGSKLPPGSIRIDDRTAPLLEPDFALVHVNGSYYLRGGDAR